MVARIAVHVERQRGRARGVVVDGNVQLEGLPRAVHRREVSPLDHPTQPREQVGVLEDALRPSFGGLQSDPSEPARCPCRSVPPRVRSETSDQRSSRGKRPGPVDSRIASGPGATAPADADSAPATPAGAAPTVPFGAGVATGVVAPPPRRARRKEDHRRRTDTGTSEDSFRDDYQHRTGRRKLLFVTPVAGSPGLPPVPTALRLASIRNTGSSRGRSWPLPASARVVPERIEGVFTWNIESSGRANG